MKKLLSLFIAAIALTSCSSDDDNNVVIPKTLQKVVFYRNSANERHWNVTNGLLRTITLADGSVAEQFTYDNLNRLITDVKYTNGVASETTTVTYTADSIIESINGLHYSYDAGTRTYAYSYGSNFTIICQVNSDFLVKDFVRAGVGAAEYHMTYSNGNMLSFQKLTSGATDVIKNFHFAGNAASAEGGEVYKAILAIARVKSLTDPNFFADCQVSKVNPDGFDKGTSDPNYYNYGEIVNMDSTLLEVGVEVLDPNNNPVSWYPFADYYYE